MKTFRLLTLISFALGVVLTVVGIILKLMDVTVGDVVLKIGLVVDIIFILSVVAWIIKAMFSE